MNVLFSALANKKDLERRAIEMTQPQKTKRPAKDLGKGKKKGKADMSRIREEASWMFREVHYIYNYNVYSFKLCFLLILFFSSHLRKAI
jgi:hypothetical protein